MSITPPSSRPTIVLVHGASSESSSWDGVVALLLEDDFPVLAVANPLRGVTDDSEPHGSYAVAIPEAELIAEAADAKASLQAEPADRKRTEVERAGVGA